MVRYWAASAASPFSRSLRLESRRYIRLSRRIRVYLLLVFLDHRLKKLRNPFHSRGIFEYLTGAVASACLPP